MSASVATAPTAQVFISSATLQLKLKEAQTTTKPAIYEWRTQVVNPAAPPPTPVVKEAPVEALNTQVLAAATAVAASKVNAVPKKYMILDNFMDGERQHSVMNRRMNQPMTNL